MGDLIAECESFCWHRGLLSGMVRCQKIESWWCNVIRLNPERSDCRVWECPPLPSNPCPTLSLCFCPSHQDHKKSFHLWFWIWALLRGGTYLAHIFSKMIRLKGNFVASSYESSGIGMIRPGENQRQVFGCKTRHHTTTLLDTKAHHRTLQHTASDYSIMTHTVAHCSTMLPYIAVYNTDH